MKPVKELARAARAGNVAKVKALLKKDPTLAKDWQPLMDACFFGHPAVVKILLSRGADPNVVSKTAHRYRPLHRVIEFKKTIPKTPEHVEVVKLLRAAGADPMARGGFSHLTAVALAATDGQRQFLPLLLKRVKERDIFTAAVIGDLPRVKVLLAKNPKLATARDETGWQPLQYCCASRLHGSDAETAEALRKIAALLLDRGVDPNSHCLWNHQWKLPALYFATGHANHPALAELLLKRGANPNDGESLFHSAEHLYLDCLDLLLKYGVDVNHQHETASNTALYFLITWTSTRGVPWLLEHGADPNLRCGENRETALHAAVRRGCNDDLFRLLLDHGAKLTVKNKDGLTPLALAQRLKNVRIVAFLKSRHG